MSSDRPAPDLRSVAERATARVRQRVLGAERDGLRVASVVHYGAVDLDPANLVVWLLLHGPEPDAIPAWLPVTPTMVTSVRPPDVSYPWLLELADQVRSAFDEAGWPDEAPPRVMVDSEARVSTAGGWSYFR